MQEIAFPGFKFQNFSGDYAPTHVAFDHWYPPLISNEKLRLIFFFTFCAFFPSFISNTSIVSINFRANLDAQNAGNGISVLQISKFFWGVQTPPQFMRSMLATHVAFSHCYPPLIYYLTERSLFKKCPPPTEKSLKKALCIGDRSFFIRRGGWWFCVLSLIISSCPLSRCRKISSGPLSTPRFLPMTPPPPRIYMHVLRKVSNVTFATF